MSAGYETLIVTFSDPIKINGHTAVITSEYNMPCVKEWLTRCTAIADIKEF